MANTSCLFLNNYQTTLGAPLSSTGTTITVSSIVGLPASLATGQFIPMTLTPASSPGSIYEIVYVTGISGANLTIERGMENTSALAWSTGDILYSTNTADTTAPLEGPNFTGPVTASGLITANGGITVPVGETATVAGTLDILGTFDVSAINVTGLITAEAGIDVSGGTAVVPNATANNEAIALGQFPYLNNTTGYQKFPSGLIMQWNALNIAANTSQVWTYSIPFTTETFSIIVTNTLSGYYAPAVTANSLTGSTIYNSSPVTQTIYALAIGY